MGARNNRSHVLAEHLPSTSIVVRSKHPNEALNVIVDECVIELREYFFERACCDTVIGQELEVRSG